MKTTTVFSRVASLVTIQSGYSQSANEFCKKQRKRKQYET